MRYIILAFLSLNAYAFQSLDFYCDSSNLSACEERVFRVMDSLGCKVDKDLISCQQKRHLVTRCQAQSVNCQEPKPMITTFVSCRKRGNKTSFKKIDPGISLTWSMGAYPKVKKLCVK